MVTILRFLLILFGTALMVTPIHGSIKHLPKERTSDGKKYLIIAFIILEVVGAGITLLGVSL